MKHAGVRFTLTLHQRQEDIVRLAESLSRHFSDVTDTARTDSRAGRAAPGDAAAPAAAEHAPFRLEHRTAIEDVDATEWDAMLGDRGTFSVAGLRFLEQAFGGVRARAQDRWRFHYYIVRDASGTPVLATWFTDALWKDDMLSATSVSALVEERRREDPYYLTSRTFSMGSLLTEGDHLYLDRSRDWRGALRHLIEAVSDHSAAAGASATVIRDIASHDVELDEVLKAQGFVRIAMPDSHVIEPVVPDDDEWLSALSVRARAHQRREVLTREHLFDVEVLSHGGRAASDAELEHLHALYRNVQARGLELNSFELAPTVLRDMLDHPAWELLIMRLRSEDDPGVPVAFGACFRGGDQYVPMVVGLDYDYVYSHGTYRQMMRRALLRAREVGARRILFGMGASLEKQRFGARVLRNWAYVQSSDHYSSEVLATLEGGARTSR